MQYYVRIGNDAPQVLTEQQIFPLIKEGKIHPQTKACPVGATAWSELGQLLPTYFLPDAKPPEEEHGAMEIVGKAGAFIAEHGGEVAGLAKTFTRRILASNFVSEAALPEERTALEAAAIPIKSPMAQNYAAWRRAVLWVAGIGLAIAGVVSFFDSFEHAFAPNIPPTLQFITMGMHVLNFVAPYLILRAALQWTNIRKSRRLAKFGWLCQFVGPILLLLLPVKEMTSKEELAAYLVESAWTMQKETVKAEIKKADGAKREELQKQLATAEKDFREKQEKDQVQAVVTQLTAGEKELEELQKSKDFKFDPAMLNTQQPLGVYVFAYGMLAVQMTVLALVTLLPRILGMFPGIVRASITLRTLVPESPLPGYVIALIEPLYGLLLFVFVVIAAQVGNGFLFFGFAFLLGSGYLIMRDVRQLAKPMDATAMNAHLKPLRMRMLISTMLGLLLLLGGFWDFFTSIGFWTILSVVCHLLGNIILLTAVGADFLLGLMKYSFDQEKQLRATPLHADLESRFADLAQVRIAQISDDEPVAPPPVA